MSLCETLDRVLNKGAVVGGDLVIAVADVELLYVGLNLVVTSVETMRQWAGDRARVRVPVRCIGAGAEAAQTRPVAATSGGVP